MGTMCSVHEVALGLFSGGLHGLRLSRLGSSLFRPLTQVGIILGIVPCLAIASTLLGGMAIRLAFTLLLATRLVALRHDELILVILGIATGTPLLGFITHVYRDWPDTVRHGFVRLHEIDAARKGVWLAIW